MSFLTKIVDGAGQPSTAGRLTGILVDCPAVTEYLTESAYPDGSARERAVISLFREDGRVKVCLNDRDTGRTLWRSADGVEDALILVEAALTDGTADWRRASNAPRGTGKRK